MIDEIRVENLALIRSATLEPSSGLTVLTGETGAGKTALLSALKLLMGGRGDKDMVRDGEDSLTVSGRFFVSDSADADADGGSDDADELIVVRRVSADGRSRATINGEMASMGELADTVAPSVDLCGQFEHQQLMKPASHGALLDAWAHDQVEEPLAAYRRALTNAQAAAEELARVQAASELSSAKLDDARFTLKRINEVNPQPDEYEQLKQDLERAEHAEALASATDTAHEALAGDGGVLDALNAAASSLDAAGSFDKRLAELASSLRETSYVLEDVASDVRDYRDDVEFDPEQLAYQQERYSALQGLLRAYGPRMEDVFAHRDEAADVVSLVDDSSAREKAARAALDQAEHELTSAADALDAVRADAAPRFAAAVTHEMGRLEMGSAQLECAIERLDRASWTQAGPSSVEFMYRPAETMQARPLARIASGGEMSRVTLAIKVVLGARDQVDTLVFDEVDAGVGGATATALAEVLVDLARTHQVIVVTHLAQVAVHGDMHYVVERVEGADGPETRLTRIGADDRIIEIARMLSGDSTDASLTHARKMLDQAKRR